jgi:hypothetical protein
VPIARRCLPVLLSISVVLLHTGCMSREERNEKRAAYAKEAADLRNRILARDQSPKDPGRSVNVELNIVDAATKAPISEPVISGSPVGFIKPKYVEKTVFRSECFIPMACYTEKGDGIARFVFGPYAITSPKLVDPLNRVYSVLYADWFVLGSGFRELSATHQWRANVGSKDYCMQRDDYEGHLGRATLRAVSDIASSRESYVSSTTVYLKRLTDHRVSRIRYHVSRSADGLMHGSKLHQEPHFKAFYDEVLGWATPENDDPFENAVYVSQLINLGTYDKQYYPGARDDRIKLDVLTNRIEKHLPAARKIYSQYDDWQVVPSNLSVVWPGSVSPKGAQSADCVSPPIVRRLPSSNDWWRSFPILPPRNHFLDERVWWRTVSQGEHYERMLRALELDPFPFCVKKALPAKGVGNPLPSASGFLSQGKDVTLRSKAHVAGGVTVNSQRTPYYSKNVQSESIDVRGATVRPRVSFAAQAAPNLKREWRVVCRYGSKERCNYDAPNGLGDSPLISLARGGSLGNTESVRFLFATVAEKVTSIERPDVVQSLFAVGADVAFVNPALDVNALEVALSPFLGGDSRMSGDDAWRAQREIAVLLLDEMERRQTGSLRADYHDALGVLESGSELRNAPGVSEAKIFPAGVVARLRKLPKRPRTTVCGSTDQFEFSNWFQSPSRIGQPFLSPLRFSP